MGEPKFTPGPWDPPHLCDDSTPCNCLSIFDGGYAGGIASIHVHNGIDSISAGGNDAPPVGEAKANGWLIASSPELYEALKGFLTYHGGHCITCPELIARVNHPRLKSEACNRACG
jgi:hypothetical protein